MSSEVRKETVTGGEQSGETGRVSGGVARNCKGDGSINDWDAVCSRMAKFTSIETNLGLT